ncbi:hypothetical protein ANO11243_031480 [Dothideomycetidae sp. 11243]|nr:hypothetical protein ANO11243_031480 [fungal sp. No.11243]
MAIRTGSIVLPEWQDDSDVAACPICKRRFHFLFRKHHCRRCGRIICDQCSPHRITLPRQYIVRPPWEAVSFRIDTDETGEDYFNPALGGGETVRVCNPCVPDPNYGPPPRQHQHQDEANESRAHSGDMVFPPYDYQNDPHRALTFHSPQRSPERTHPDRYRSTRGPISPTRRPRPYFSHTAGPDGVPASQILEARFQSRAQRGTSDSPLPRIPQHHHHSSLHEILSAAQPIPSAVQSPRRSSQQRLPSGSAPPAYVLRPDRSLIAPWESPLHVNSVRATGHRRPPAQPVREEDECPVCGTHAPPFGPRGDQTERERHIETCISSHLQFSSTPRSTSAMPAGITPPATTSTTNEPFNAARMPQLSSSSSSTSRPRAPTTTTTQRMLVYLATEKDAHDDDQECVICLDVFEPGQQLARLECLCRFHRTCITSWWERGTAAAASSSVGGAKVERWGTCPTHALQA